MRKRFTPSRKLLLKYCVLMLALANLCGCGPRTILVHVQDAETAAPIGNARVKLAVSDPNLWGRTAPSTEGTTDVRGDAVIKQPDPGRTPTAEVTAPDYLPSGKILAIGPKVSFTLYHEPGASFQIIIPAGYRGPVPLEFELNKSFKPPPPGTREFTYRFMPGHALYPEIPTPMIANVQAAQYRVSYSDGTPIPPQTQSTSPQAVCWRLAAERYDHNVLRRVFVVGSEGDAFRAQQEEAARSR